MILIVALALVALVAFPLPGQAAGEHPIILAAGPQGGASAQPAADEKKEQEPTPAEKMARRFPQPARVGDLIGLSLLDWNDSIIGYVEAIVRTPSGQVQLIVPYRPLFGWLPPCGICDWGRRPVAVPLETVAALGPQLAALDMSREQFDAAPTFNVTQATPIPAGETIRIAITRR